MPDSSVFHEEVTANDYYGTTYQKVFLALRDGPYIDFPAVVGIETMSLCNARCDFCPYPNLDRKGESMPDQLIEKILSDIESIQDRPPFQVNLSRVNEPFLDTRVFAISSDIERRLPEARHMFFSNGTPLTEKNLLRLAELKRVGFLIVSVNEHRAQRYEEVMGLPFAKTLARLDVMHRMKAAGVLTFPIMLSKVGDGTAADGEFLQWGTNTYPLFSGMVPARSSWMGATPPLPGAAAPDVGCRQWFELHFLANGKSALCAIDSDGRHGTGDPRSQHSVHEIYNHPLNRNRRLAIASRFQIESCRSCTMLA